MNLNKAFLLGNLTSDPELRNLPSGQAVCSFRMATNQIWTDKETGQKQQKAEYHNIVAWRNLATIASQYLRKGSLVFIEGKIATRSWDDPSGTKKYRTEVVADNIQLGPRPAGASPKSNGPEKGNSDDDDGSPSGDIPTIEEGDDINIEEIPF
ncbi:MAG: single-stranded DNA-binding protein [Parcubacteria group bacterium CG08_land_8_20_14_0_20_43_9]|nr:MAG: single-stranded DNA-binding protein [Parcubacteria group bacterium CG08_land_8_20_14_0_20_43_9]